MEYIYHCLIVLKVSKVDWGLKPFRVLDCWFQDGNFENFYGGVMEEDVNSRMGNIYTYREVERPKVKLEGMKCK